MDKALVENWNSVVAKEDVVYNIGDLALSNDVFYVKSLLERLNGFIYHIEGNHDHLAHKLRGRFSGWNQMREVTVEGQKIVLCHYAMRTWHHDLRGTWHLYGHTHSLLPAFGKSVDVGVDNSHNIAPDAHFRPISFDELKKYMDKRPIADHPKF